MKKKKTARNNGGGNAGRLAGFSASEKGAIKKSRRGRLTVALCYPNAYELAMGNLGFHQVYHLLNSYDDIACERAVLGKEGERPVTIESGTPISEFELIAFSISFEPDITNLASMLKNAGIPLSPERRRKEESPLVVVGGVMAIMNPEPLAQFADVIAIGEAEPMLHGMLEAYIDSRELPRRETLQQMSRVSGLYAPSLYEVSYSDNGSGIVDRKPLYKGVPATVSRVICTDLSAAPARTRIYTDRAEFGNMNLIELGRGCIHGCRFCAGAYVYRPPRWVKAAALETALDGDLNKRDRIGLVSASATDHPEFNKIISWVRGCGKGHSFASLRLDQISEELIDEIKRAGHKSITVAPEAGSERLRMIANKPITDRQISRAMELIGSRGIQRLKLYFQVGLPHENRQDIEAVPPLIAMMKAFLARGAQKNKWPGRISVSINPFVPKPGTPFQWHPMEDKSSLKKKIEFLERTLKKMGGITVSGNSVREAMFQSLISRGDRRVGLGIARAVERDKNPAAYMKTGTKKVPPSDWYVYRAFKENDILPWDFIDHRVSKTLLWKDYQRAAARRTMPSCQPGKCELCDACKLRQAPPA